MKSLILILFLVFFITGVGTLWTGLVFPFEIQNEQLASYLCLVIAGIILIAYYITIAKNKNRARD